VEIKICEASSEGTGSVRSLRLAVLESDNLSGNSNEPANVLWLMRIEFTEIGWNAEWLTAMKDVSIVAFQDPRNLLSELHALITFSA
jgi:hypothetical protein